ncbi:hypothetical protein U0070_000314, partial [Myodes glareolus]
MTSMESENTKKIQEMKTDLNLLLECLKYHMGNPLSQKEVLITIHSICKQNSDAGVYFREIGGLMFVESLAKSSEHSMVKEAALYTLGSIAEENVYCQQTLCTSELFQDLILLLSNDDSNINLKRMSIYVLLVLVSNNNENQMLCCSLFPYVNEWLVNCMKPEVIRPICSFIGLTLANNTHVQNCFVSSGGLDVLSQVLVQLELDSHNTFFSAKLAVMVTKTLDACITNNLMINSLFSFPYFSLPCIPYYKAEKLSLSLRDISFDENEANQQKDINEKENLEEHWKTAKEIICRIKQFEREGKE